MATSPIISGTIQYRPYLQPIHARNRARIGIKASPAPERVDTSAFLTQRFESIKLSESPLMRIKTDGLYEALSASCEAVFRILGGGFPLECINDVDGLERTLDAMRKWALEKDLDFMVTKNADDEVKFVLYREVCCMDLHAFFFYCSPADYLPKETGTLYRRFIHFVALSIGISVIPDSTDNHYLEMLINCNDDDDENEHTDLYDLYSKKGKLYGKFKAVNDAPTNGLKEDLEAHLKVCSAKYIDLVTLMLEGMDIVPCMNVSCYDFNPFYDGFGSCDSHIETMSTLAILYSPNDKMDDEMLKCINSDLNCGLMSQGWNRWLIMRPDLTKADFDELLQDEEIPKKFIDWSNRFYVEMEKFDKYGTH